jgi:cell division protein FtsI/penicillin-binding protein 2
MRRAVLLAGGALIAAVFALARPGDSEPTRARKAEPAMIQGAPLADSPRAEAPKPAPTVLLDKMELVGDHYEAPLSDGTRAKLTLDPELQKQAEKLLDQSRAPRGAIVAMAPDGRILAIAGRKTDEPKGGTKGQRDFDLATHAWAPAASVFKLVTASALVEAGVDPDDKVCYHGGIRSVRESNLVDSKHDGRCESLLYGVAHSNNAILGKLAYQKLEPGALDALAHDLLGTNAELTLPHEKNLAFAQSAAGFTGVRLSAMGGALLAATFADAGEQPVPHLIADAAPASHRILPAEVAKAVSRMMVGTCEFGSAARSFGKRASVAGKTGTLVTREPFYMENSWFVGYAPADKPEIIVSVLLGNPESWHLRGHEAAKKLIDRAMRRDPDRAARADDRPRKHRR